MIPTEWNQLTVVQACMAMAQVLADTFAAAAEQAPHADRPVQLRDIEGAEA